MDLLNPEKIKDEKKARVEEQIQRSQDAAKEETRVVRSLNETREFYESETARLRAEHEAEIKPLEDRKRDLTNRVQSLEERKREALKPIKHLQVQAEEHMQRAKLRHDEADEREMALTTREDEMDRKMDEIADIREDLRIREEKIKKTEEGLEVAKVISAASQDDLSGKWIAYHKAVQIYNDSVAEKELRLAEREGKCRVWEEALGVREAEATAKDQEIQSRYKALEDAEERNTSHD